MTSATKKLKVTDIEQVPNRSTFNFNFEVGSELRVGVLEIEGVENIVKSGRYHLLLDKGEMFSWKEISLKINQLVRSMPKDTT